MIHGFTEDELVDLFVPQRALQDFDPSGLRVWVEGALPQVAVAEPPPKRWIPMQEGYCVALPGNRYLDLNTGTYREGRVYLDFEDRHTRSRATEWLAERVGIYLGCTSPGWKHAGAGTWILMGAPGSTAAWAPSPHPNPGHRRPRGRVDRRECPGLDTVDTEDERVLRDGSLYAEAHALVLVVWHEGMRG